MVTGADQHGCGVAAHHLPTGIRGTLAFHRLVVSGVGGRARASSVRPPVNLGPGVTSGATLARAGDVPRSADVLTARLAGWLLLALVALTYVYFNYTRIPGPPYINPRLSPAYGGGLHSACPFGVPGCG